MNVRDYLHGINSQKYTLRSADDTQEPKRKMSNEEAQLEQLNKNKELSMHIYKVLSTRSKGLDESRRNATMRVVSITEKMMNIAMEYERMFQEYFRNPVKKEDPEMKLEIVEANKYEMRIYLKSFPVPDAFQTNFGASHGVPHGSASVTINKYMGRVDKMIVTREWEDVIADECLCPTKIIPWFSDGLLRAIRSIQTDDSDPDNDKVFATRCETGIHLEILPDNLWKESKDSKVKKHSLASLDQTSMTSARQNPIHVSCIPCIFGTGLPKGMRLQHALPNREPYASQGKELIDQMMDEIGEGRSLYTLDACLTLDSNGDPVGGHWITNFRTMTERVINGARLFSKVNVIDPAIWVIEMISISRHWDIPITVIETAALWEFKKSADKLRNEATCFRNVLSRLHRYFKQKSCPNFLIANYNMLKTEDESWCEVIAKELGDAVSALEDDPAILLELTGTKRKGRSDTQLVLHEKNSVSDDK